MKWIKHDTNANADAKLQNVLLDYGIEGYGLYWYCIELIAGRVDKDNITFELEHDARIIARNIGSTSQKVSEMMKYFVELGLFEDSNGIISCLKLADRLDKSMTSNPQMRDIIQSFKDNSHDLVMTESEKPMQDKIRLDKIRLNNKEKKKSLKKYLDQCNSKNVDAIPEDSIVFINSDKLGIPRDFIFIAWLNFKEYYLKNENKKYTDWIGTFNNAVKVDGYGTYKQNSNDEWYLTQKGKNASILLGDNNG